MIYNILLYIYNFIFYCISLLSFIFIFGKNKNKIKQRLLLNKHYSSNVKYIWIHGASVGEVLSAKSLVYTLLEKYKNNYKIIITSHTATSKNIVESTFDNRVTHHYLPYDCGILANKFIKRYKPAIVLWVEQDFFPIFLHKIYKNKIPLLLLNARMSNGSFKKWKKLKFVIFNILNYFTALYPMSLSNKRKIDYLSNKNNKFIGNLKYTNITTKEETLAKFFNYTALLQNYLNQSSVLTALSTHEKEENIIADLHFKLKVKSINIKTIIIPRHINRINNIIKGFSKKNIKVALFSDLILGKASKEDIVLVDIMGKSSVFCCFSDITFIGKSLYLKGGHNLLEPLSVGCPVIFGKNMGNFKDIVTDTLNNKAGIKVKNEEELFFKLLDIFSNKEKLLTLKNNTSFIQKDKNNILTNFMGELDCYLKI